MSFIQYYSLGVLLKFLSVCGSEESLESIYRRRSTKPCVEEGSAPELLDRIPEIPEELLSDLTGSEFEQVSGSSVQTEFQSQGSCQC